MVKLSRVQVRNRPRYLTLLLGTRVPRMRGIEERLLSGVRTGHPGMGLERSVDRSCCVLPFVSAFDPWSVRY